MNADPIVVAGGGYAGFWAAMAARRIAGPEQPIRMVSRDPILQMRPRLYEAAPETLGIDLRPLLDRTGIDFQAGEATAIADNTLVLSTGERIPYARLVVATGSQLRRPPIPGADRAYSIDTQSDAIAFDRRLAEIARTTAAPRLAVIGAGFTGIELALELRDRLALYSDAVLGERLEILLVDAAPELGPELGPGPRPVIADAMAQARVILRLGARLARIDPAGLAFTDGTTWPADAVVLTTGMVAAPFTAQIPGHRDTLGRITVETFLRAPAAPTVFVTGDAAAADTGTGQIAVQSCQHALTMGRFAGANAARDLLGQPLVPYSQPRYGNCLDLGRFGAVRTQGWDRTVIAAGLEAKTVKRHINTVVIYPPAEATGQELLVLAEV